MILNALQAIRPTVTMRTNAYIILLCFAGITCLKAVEINPAATLGARQEIVYLQTEEVVVGENEKRTFSTEYNLGPNETYIPWISQGSPRFIGLNSISVRLPNGKVYDQALSMQGPATLILSVEVSRFDGEDNGQGGWIVPATEWAFIFYILDMNSNSGASTSPRYIVIPENAEGNVEVVMETSTDLINWTETSPGFFSSETDKGRFFRLKAIPSQ